MRRSLVLAAAGSSLVLAAAGNAAEFVTPPTGAAALPRFATPAPARRAGISQIRAGGAPIILEASKGTLLRLPRPASTVFIANPEIADVQVKSPMLIYVSAKLPGETVLYAVDAQDEVLLNAPVRVEHDLSRLRQLLHHLMPGEHIDVHSVEGSVVLSRNVSTAGRAEKARSLAAAVAADVKGSQVVNQLAVAIPNQVSLRVRIAEVNRNILKELGFNWSKAPTTQAPLNGPALSFLTQNPTTVVGHAERNIFNFGRLLTGTGQPVSATLDALAQEGFVTTLAEPNLTAMSGQTASFLAGGEFPVPVAVAPATGGAVGPTITIQFKTFGVALDFTPTIIDANHLSLRIRPEVSALSNNGAVQISGFSIPALTVRRAETTVELGSGESFALAGLLQHTSEQDVSKIPGLGDIPIIGQLFRSDRFQHNESELVIIVTPYLVRPAATALSVPTDGFVLPHDAQRVINSEVYRQGLPGPRKGPIGTGGQGLIGPVGFRVD